MYSTAISEKKNVPWLTKSITSHIKKRNAAFQATKKRARPKSLAKYKKLRNRVVKMLREAKCSYLKQLNVMNKREFWKAVKVLSKQQSMIPTLHHQHVIAETNYEKATMLNDYFLTCFNRSVSPLSHLDSVWLDHIVQETICPEDLLCTTEEVLSYIQELDITKASGPDRISNRMLKYTAANIAPSLTKLFNISIQNGKFPACWKTSSVVPVPKLSEHKEASNYRPISLLSVVSKMLERHIYNMILYHINDTSPLSNKQWGYQGGKSTVSALLAVTHDWFKTLEMKQEVCTIFFDLKKAFDSVPHKLLLRKLSKYALNSHILSWLYSYLTDRKQHVVVGGDSSSDLSVLSGVPQGSVLGPLLFLIYIDDVSTIELSEDCILNLYADDMLLYKTVRSNEDYYQLQSDIDKISMWVDKNHLSFNLMKCKSMLLTRKKNPSQPPKLLLNNMQIKQVETFKYLGVLIASDLSWSPHIDSICTKAKKLIGLLYRRFSTTVQNEKMLELYVSLVRPHLEYAASVWDPHLVKDITYVENVQKYGLKMCLKQWNLGYYDLLDMAHLPTLKNRRLYLKLCYLYKIIHGFFYFTPDVFKSPSCMNDLNLPLLHQPFAHTNSYKSSFVPSTIAVWNYLPHQALQAHSVYSFKSHIAPFFL